MLEREALDEGDPLQDGGVRVQVVGGRAEGEALGAGRDEGESLAGLGQGVDDGVDRAELAGGGVERVEVGARKELGEYAGAGAGRAAREPAAVRVAVAVDGTGRVVEEAFADAFEDERRTEDRVPGAGGEGAGGDLGGAAVGHPGVDGDARPGCGRARCRGARLRGKR